MNATTTTGAPHRVIAVVRAFSRAFIGLIVSIAVLAGLALNAGPAYAHATYESSTPGDGETVSESPDVVEITFSQEMRRSQGLPTANVFNDSGDTVSVDTTLSDDDRTLLIIDLAPSLPDGRYTVIYHVLSDADGDDSQGAFHFFVGQPAGDTASPTESPIDSTDAPTFTPSPTATLEPTPTDDDNGDDSDGVPVWALITGIAAAAVVAGATGLGIGRMATR
jgi:methionine-rich copper-binding protein CopC